MPLRVLRARAVRVGQSALRDQIHRALDRNANHAGVPVDPAVAVQLLLLRRLGTDRDQPRCRFASCGRRRATCALNRDPRRRSGRRMLLFEECETNPQPMTWITTAATIRPTANHATPRTLMSLRLVTDWSCACWSAIGRLLSGLNGEQRRSFQEMKKHREPESAERDELREDRASERKTLADEMPARPARNLLTTFAATMQSAMTASAAVFASPARESRSANGSKNSTDHEASATHCQPPRLRSQIPGNFLRQIARPDDEELRERDVGPENHEGEEHVAEIVEAFVGNRRRGRGSCSRKRRAARS